ncbi:hypothetical protein BKH43_00995 [Helicobacter sp. 13S00401-1]|uniref:trimeric intracellular cation channel family protein n=1 Tax=Helicobacter sp. 13S00401-1 TaxID=1905758 RepID=UPI000BA5EC48|nr:trimeric intracellular cation channel family protein [Helicobacter sp. 13S00401-1]PAF51841.1 hypothetical protein BKH43_00995 [Helicobacter sp. 13S00401-1]
MILFVLYIIGIIAEAITGALAAGRHKMDLFGVMLISLLTAIGGGTVRDVILGSYPTTWVLHPEYVLMLCVVSLLTVAMPYFLARFGKLFLLLDALGLVAFSIIGVDKALSLGHGIIVCVVAGVFTGVAGGILRDLLCNKIPLVFQKEVYAGVSIVTCILYYLLTKTSLNHNLIVIITLVFGFSFRALAIYYKLGLPVFNYDEEKALRLHEERVAKRKARRDKRLKEEAALKATTKEVQELEKEVKNLQDSKNHKG